MEYYQTKDIWVLFSTPRRFPRFECGLKSNAHFSKILFRSWSFTRPSIWKVNYFMDCGALSCLWNLPLKIPHLCFWLEWFFYFPYGLGTSTTPFNTYSNLNHDFFQIIKDIEVLINYFMLINTSRHFTKVPRGNKLWFWVFFEFPQFREKLCSF